MTENSHQEEQPTQEQSATPGEEEPRPDRQGPRGNPETEQQDVVRG